MIYVPYLLLVCVAGLTPPGPPQVGGGPGSRGPARSSRTLGPVLARKRAQPARLQGLRGGTLARASIRTTSILITNLYSDPPLLYYFPDRLAQFVPPADVRRRAPGRIRSPRVGRPLRGPGDERRHARGRRRAAAGRAGDRRRVARAALSAVAVSEFGRPRRRPRAPSRELADDVERSPPRARGPPGFEALSWVGNV